jgi:serine/threonine protein phosphatase 1
MNFVIGDIHGELIKLQKLLKNIFSVDENPTLIFIGDYLDKGEDPYGTMKYLGNLASTRDCVFLRGNHEFYWEKLKDRDDEFSSYLLKYGGKNTIFSIGKDLTIVEAKDILL